MMSVTTYKAITINFCFLLLIFPVMYNLDIILPAIGIEKEVSAVARSYVIHSYIGLFF
jgi:hypothetical protein